MILLSLSEGFSGLGTMEQMFWTCALVATAVFLIQMVLTMVGMDSSNVDVDFDVSDFGDGSTLDMGGGRSLFSIRNLINFLLGFGWAGVSLGPSIGQNVWLVVVAVLVGLAFVWMFFYVRRQAKKLEANGAFNIHDCLGRTANVYLRIPAENGGKGKVQVSVNGATHEIDAFTNGEAIPSGGLVRITEVIDGETLRVEKA